VFECIHLIQNQALLAAVQLQAALLSDGQCMKQIAGDVAELRLLAISVNVTIRNVTL
jgi:hypothetical protein